MLLHTYGDAFLLVVHHFSLTYVCVCVCESVAVNCSHVPTGLIEDPLERFRPTRRVPETQLYTCGELHDFLDAMMQFVVESYMSTSIEVSEMIYDSN